MPAYNSQDHDQQRHRLQRAKQPAEHSDDGHKDAVPVSRYSSSLLGHSTLSGRGNGPVHTAMMQQMQQSYGNRALQRYLQRTATSQQSRAGDMHKCGPGCNHSVQRMPVPGGVVSIQRHAAYEHYALGQIAPSRIKEIPEVRAAATERNQLRSEVEALQLAVAQGSSPYEAQRLQETQQKLAAARTRLVNSPLAKSVQHTIKQEMDRLMKWKSDPEAHRGEATGKPVKGKDGEWQVPFVTMPVKGDAENAEPGKESIVVAYSELNTLPDFFGNPETIANTRKSKVLALLQGVREQSYNELGKIYNEIFEQDINKLKGTIVDDEFQGAKGPTGKAWIDSAYEIRKEDEVNTQTLPGKGETKGLSEQYFAAVERNACHFAPYSWDAWQEYHEAALKDARASHEARRNGNEAKANELGNSAMLKTGFGEHYLQDSFAGGHLIDKTRIMQTFLQWSNKDKGHLGSSDTAKAQWAIMSTVADQDLKSNPQALDDMMHRGKDQHSVEAYTAKANLKVQPEIEFMMWWRHEAFANAQMKEITPETAAAKAPMVANDPTKAKQLMDKLVTGQFAEVVSRGWKLWDRKQFYSLNQSQIDVLKTDKEGKGQGAYQANIAYAGMKKEKAPDYKKEAHEFNLAAYNLFLSNAFIQGATKYFHDKYCKEGIEVVTGEGAAIGRVYGDSNMLTAGGQKGVEYSAETSKRSRESVFNVMETGKDPEGQHTTSEIRKRFPTQVKPGPNDAPISLADWNANHLVTEYDKGWLNPASSNKARALYKVQGGISKGNALDVPEMTKHDAGPF
ncbi:MAG TPA: hypothetical protein VEW94_08250 [Chloroflexia bacterium]|nr:hypothetical protein [Chloroflexia bacterium]